MENDQRVFRVFDKSTTTEQQVTGVKELALVVGVPETEIPQLRLLKVSFNNQFQVTESSPT